MSSGTHITTWSGAMEKTQGNVTWVDFGVFVSFFIPPISAAASTSSSTINMDTPLPSNLWPSSQREVSGWAISGGVTVGATFTIGTDGSVTVSISGGFSTSGTNGLPFQGISYSK